MKICIIGTGYVGLVSGVCFADLGNIVHCVDNNIVKINMLNQGSLPIYEPGLEEMVKRNYEDKRLVFTTDLKEAVTYSDIIFICVGTPTIKNSNSVDLKYVFRVVNDIRKYIKKFKIIITKSTRLPFLIVGVPTQINIISEYVTAFFRSVVKINLLSS